jgi:L-fucose isomerase-like protein
MAKQPKTTLAVLVGTRGFFPTHLAAEGRKAILKVLNDEGFDTVCLPASAATGGAVETLADARACADLFREHLGQIDGVVVTLPNFGDEKAVANTLRFADLDVPVLVHAWPDDPADMTLANRRDAFCGKMSVCCNLDQYGIPCSLTDLHTVDPASEAFRTDLARFGATCRVVRGLYGARVGAVGARTGPFNTVRFSEKILEGAGISVETVDLSEILGRAAAIKPDDADLAKRLKAIRGYTDCSAVTDESLDRMARFALVLDRWMAETEVVGTAIQCWTALEEYYGIVPCTVMSMMSEALKPSACEVDITGLVGMLALRYATETPAAIVDWNNNYGDDPEKCVLFHCSNLPKSLFAEQRMAVQDIISQTVGDENAAGTIVGRLAAGPFTFCRVDTDDAEGEVRAYVGEGDLTDDPLETFGGRGVAHIPDLQLLLQVICRLGFEHHVAIARGQAAEAVEDAFETYLGWETYLHAG